ncbi:MAG: DUF420 domain-containing protein [Methanobacteriota archaeon]|nr:MAG: DUF420 domain-containing protein [Euryarchaeota archaeon]
MSPPLVVMVMLIGETILAVTLVTSLLLAAKHRGIQHHYLMISVFIIDMVVFKLLMISKAVDGSNGSFPWDGTNILGHLLMSIGVAFLGGMSILLGLRNVIRRDSRMFLPPSGKLHRVFGSAFIVLWIAAYLTGLVLYANNWG